MFTLKFNIPNVKSFDLGEGGVYYLDHKNTLTRLGGSSFTDASLSFGSLSVIENTVFFQNYNGFLWVFDFNLDRLIYTNQYENFKLYLNPTSCLSKSTGFYTAKIIDDLEKFGIFDFSSKKFEEINLVPGKILIKEGIIVQYGKSDLISCCSLAKNTKLWETRITESYNNILGEIKKDGVFQFIGCYKENLWFSLFSGNLMAFHANLGIRSYFIGFSESELPAFPFSVKIGDYLPYGELIQLDESKGELIGLRSKYFVHVDLNQSKLKRECVDIGKSMSYHDMESSYRNSYFPIDENYIYFCDDRRGKIGIFDRCKREVVWSYELEMERSGIAQILEMKYASDHWYVLDRNDTLHVFERTKIN